MKNLSEGVKKFSDSKEIANALRLVKADSGTDQYWLKEAACHIEAMYSLLVSMSRIQKSRSSGDPDRLIDLPEILEMLSVKKSSWWLWVKNGKAPAPVYIMGSTRWRHSEISALVEVGIDGPRRGTAGRSA